MRAGNTQQSTHLFQRQTFRAALLKHLRHHRKPGHSRLISSHDGLELRASCSKYGKSQPRSYGADLGWPQCTPFRASLPACCKKRPAHAVHLLCVPAGCPVCCVHGNDAVSNSAWVGHVGPPSDVYAAHTGGVVELCCEQLTLCCLCAEREPHQGQALAQAELSDWLLDPPEGCCLEKFEPLMEW